ncbi:Uncharacterised protein [Comamonas terrigena]|nr:hypothetical protein CT3_28160 [Comamonas terrigena NBRC 13299]SUY71061.1 Uncharacterised protein [Comamonas terrigena]
MEAVGPGAVAPTPGDAMRRLRLDDDLAEDVEAAIPQALAEAEVFLDGKLYATAQAKADAQDLRGIVCTPDIIAAQLLLVDALVADNGEDAVETKRTRAFNMLRRHRNMGA